MVAKLITKTYRSDIWVEYEVHRMMPSHVGAILFAGISAGR
jgi:hypothetical protein